MEWYGYFLIGTSSLLFIAVVLIVLAREQIKLRLKAFLFRKGSSLLYTELGDDLKIKQGVAKLEDGRISTSSSKTYSVDKKHIYLLATYGITGVVLSEKLGTSIDPQGSSNYSATVINGIIKRIKATALGEAMNIIKIMYMILAAFGVIVVIQIFMIIKFYMALKTAGIEITF